MWQQKQNNFTRLDELSRLPGEIPMDKNAAWQKLEGRLHKTPVRVKPGWYWIAACLLLAGPIPFFIQKNKSQDSFVKVSRPAQNMIIPVKTYGENENIVLTTPSGINKHSTENRAFIHANSPSKKLFVTVIPPDSVIEPVVLNQIKAANIIATPDTIALTAAAPLKKKLNIVNTNELDDADRFAAQHLPKTGANYTNTKNAAKKEYAGMLNFRFYLKN
jgi:hypothetical protein